MFFFGEYPRPEIYDQWIKQGDELHDTLRDQGTMVIDD